MIDSPDTQKDLFLLKDGITYLNCANMSPMLKAALIPSASYGIALAAKNLKAKEGKDRHS